MTTEQRVFQLLRNQRLFTILSMIAGPAISYWALTGVTGILWWFLFILLSGFSVWLLFFLALGVNMYMVYVRTGNTEELIGKPEEEFAEPELAFVIHETSEQIGSFKDAPIHDWIDFKLNDQIFRANFLGTVNLNEAVTIPDNTIVLPPGLVYEFQDDMALNITS